METCGGPSACCESATVGAAREPFSSVENRATWRRRVASDVSFAEEKTLQPFEGFPSAYPASLASLRSGPNDAVRRTAITAPLTGIPEHRTGQPLLRP